MGRVAKLFIAAERRKPMKPVDQVIALTDRGFEGCVHARQGSKRQVLVVDRETLEEFDLAPGVVRENIHDCGCEYRSTQGRAAARGWRGPSRGDDPLRAVSSHGRNPNGFAGSVEEP